jgi:CheY-like chemotaxis protein
MKRLINILLIEDDYLDQLEVQRVMDKRSILYKLKIARNGEEGLQMLREKSGPSFEGSPDIIILDLNMPKMNGFEFLQSLKPEDVKNIKIFVLTTSDEKEDKLLSKQLGVSGFITKPLKLESPSSIDAFNLMIDLMNMQN